MDVNCYSLPVQLKLIMDLSMNYQPATMSFQDHFAPVIPFQVKLK